jgi:exonuclease VII large subunit
MHLLAAEPGRIDDGEVAVDLEQAPADIVILSAADTELAALAEAFERETFGLSLRVANLGKLLASLSPRAPLERGYALIHRADGSLARSAPALSSGEALVLEFRDGKRGAVVDGAPAPKPAKTKAPPPDQGSLF